jgi:hypothetical protein
MCLLARLLPRQLHQRFIELKVELWSIPSKLHWFQLQQPDSFR